MKKIIICLTFIIHSSYSYSQLIIRGSEDSITKQREKALLSIEIWKMPIDTLTGRRQIGGDMSDKLVSSLVGFHVGRGYIITAAHAFKEIKDIIRNNKSQSGYSLKVYDHQNRPIYIDGIGKCGETYKDAEPDICVLKSKFISKMPFFELPKEIYLEPSQSVEIGLINKSIHIQGRDRLLKGNFVKSLVRKENINSNIKLWRSTIRTNKGNSGSPVFDTFDGKILGMTTNSYKLETEEEKDKKAEIIPTQYIRSYLNAKDWKLVPLPSDMHSYDAIILKKELEDSKK